MVDDLCHMGRFTCSDRLSMELLFSLGGVSHGRWLSAGTSSVATLERIHAKLGVQLR